MLNLGRSSPANLPLQQILAGGTPDNAGPIYAGWSSLVARQAHNLKVVGSNPAPATNLTERRSVADKAALTRAAFLLPGVCP